jgi:iron(III) transport system substrate-binding protein
VPAEWKDPDSAYITVRVPVMVLGVNPKALPQAPRRWKDLEAAAWKGKISMGSPLESGTTFTAVTVLEKNFGWSYIESLRTQETISAGGNSAVLNRIETGERPVGILLLENLLKAKEKGSLVDVIYPEDGVLPIPSPIAITAKTAHPELAKKVVDWFFSEEAQREIVKSGMYSALPLDLTPPGGRPWAELKKSALRFDSQLVSELFPAREQTKTKFQSLWLGG